MIKGRLLLLGTSFSKVKPFCGFLLTVLPSSSRFTGQNFVAVPQIQVSSCVFWPFVPIDTVGVFIGSVSSPLCCHSRRISIWTDVGQNLSSVSHLCLVLATGRYGW